MLGAGSREDDERDRRAGAQAACRETKLKGAVEAWGTGGLGTPLSLQIEDWPPGGLSTQRPVLHFNISDSEDKGFMAVMTPSFILFSAAELGALSGQ